MDEPLEGIVVSDTTIPYCPHTNVTTFYNREAWPHNGCDILQVCEKCGNKTYLVSFDPVWKKK